MRVIPAEDRELYRYGVQHGFILLLNLATAILIGWACNMFVESLVFLVSYIPLRQYAGGYHAKSNIRCYVYSIVMILVVLLTLRLSCWNFGISLIVISIGLCIILTFAPVEDSNKPLDELEVKVYRKKSYQFAIVDVCLFMIAAVLNQQRMYETVALSILSLGILVLIGKIEDSFHQNEKHDGR